MSKHTCHALHCETPCAPSLLMCTSVGIKYRRLSKGEFTKPLTWESPEERTLLKNGTMPLTQQFIMWPLESTTAYGED